MELPKAFQKSPENTITRNVVSQVQGLNLERQKIIDFYGVSLPEALHDEFGEMAPHVIVTNTGDYHQIDVIGDAKEDTPEINPVVTYLVFPKRMGHKEQVRFKRTLLINDRRQPSVDTRIAPLEQLQNVSSILGGLILQETSQS